MFFRAITPTLVRRAIVGCLMMALAFLATADVLQALCFSSEAEESCAVTDQERGSGNEQDCDHCLACIVAHGHVLAIRPSTALASPIRVASPFLPTTSIEIPAPQSQEIFHPPLVIVAVS